MPCHALVMGDPFNVEGTEKFHINTKLKVGWNIEEG
jgi:hypothetical protein